MISESKFQAEVIAYLSELFPGCVILKNDPNYLQGFPDLTILFNDRWATLDPKRSPDAPHQPNQDYWCDLLDDMSFSRFIDPENKEEVYRELQRAFRA